MSIEERNDSIRMIAVVLMVIDHVGAAFFPENYWMRVPGRIVFPIFAFGVAMGICHTKNIRNYMIRLLVGAVISQPIYGALFPGGWNIIFTMLYGGIVLILWEKKNPILKMGGALLLIGSIFLPKLDYGWYGVFTIFLFFQLGKDKQLCAIAQTILQGCFILSGGAWIQAFSLLSLPLIYKEWKTKICLPKYFFYVFYPCHLAVLLLLRRIL